MNRHNAPPVAYPLGRSHFLGSLLLGVWLTGLVLMALWFDLTRLAGWPLLSGLAAVLVAGIAVAIGWKGSPQGQLAWDGLAWRWESARGECMGAQALAVLADVQCCLLLRLDGPAGARLWLWAERRSAPARWLDLRRAAYASPRACAAALHEPLSAGSSPSVSCAASAVAVSGMPSGAATSTQP